MAIKFYPDLIQGSEAWLAARCGLLTASEMKLIVSPPPEPETRVKKNGEPYKQREWSPVANNDKCRSHLYELLGQRITGHVEPHYISDDMLRGYEDEIVARALYAAHYAPVSDMGFITNDKWGFTLGCSPDGLVGDDGLIECKSRRHKYQVQTILENVFECSVPDEYALQIQTALLVSERSWCDFVSFSGGLPMVTIRVFPNLAVHKAIVNAATDFEDTLALKLGRYRLMLEKPAPHERLVPTERRVELDMHL